MTPTPASRRRTSRSCAPLALVALSASLGAAPAFALPPSPLATRLDAALAANRDAMIEWRRHIHQHPELGNREVETARFVAERLRSFGLEPRTGVARTGVVERLAPGRVREVPKTTGAVTPSGQMAADFLLAGRR